MWSPRCEGPPRGFVVPGSRRTGRAWLVCAAVDEQRSCAHGQRHSGPEHGGSRACGLGSPARSPRRYVRPASLSRSIERPCRGTDRDGSSVGAIPTGSRSRVSTCPERRSHVECAHVGGRCEGWCSDRGGWGARHRGDGIDWVLAASRSASSTGGVSPPSPDRCGRVGRVAGRRRDGRASLRRRPATTCLDRVIVGGADRGHVQGRAGVVEAADQSVALGCGQS